MSLARHKEYLTVARTLTELREQEPRLRAAGFRKRRNANGQSPNTGEFFQWWDRKKDKSVNGARLAWVKRQRESGRCIICGKEAAESTRSGPSQYCDTHRNRNREYMRKYMRVRNNSQREYRRPTR